MVPAENKGNMLRGGFGVAFRRLCCIPECPDANACPIPESCPYKLIFEPSPPAGAERLSRNQDIPRPFIFHPPSSTQTRFEKGEPFEFELVLIGDAFEFLPYFILSIRELAEGGLGLNRARCKLDRVLSLHSSPGSLIYSGEDQVFQSVNAVASSEWIESRLGEFQSSLRGSKSTIGIRFLTPTSIRAEGQVIHQPEFHHIFKRVRDRVNALSTFYGDGPLDVDFRGLGERSERVKMLSGRFEWVDRARTSSKTGQRHQLSGFVGEAVYEGELGEFLSWLVMGELVHVGKHAPWGNGQMQLL